MEIINAPLLAYESLEFIEEAHIVVERGTIVEVNEGFVSEGINTTKYLAMPPPINAHTHVGDSFAKEAVVGLNVLDAVGPKGVKWHLYRGTHEDRILRGMRDSINYMLDSGTTTFADFREGGREGVDLIKKALEESKIRAIILGRDIDIRECEGLGLNTYQLDQIQDEREGKIVAVHAGEEKGEIEAVLGYNPDIIIHATNATDDEIKKIAHKGISVVVCPRSNASLGAGFPKVREMLDVGVNVALGTDNVMINSPNMFREMEFLSKISCLNERVDPESILRMVTSNAAKAFNINTGVIDKGMRADLIFIDKDAPNIRDNNALIPAIVHRCEPGNVRKVMVDGEFVVDKDRYG